MTQEAVLQPMLAMVVLTFAVALWMLALRIRAVRDGSLPAKYFRLNRGGREPAQLAQVSQNFHNLLELPPLFYVALVVIYVIGRADELYVLLAWLYVISRLVHSMVHTTYNHVGHRLAAFLFSCGLLGALWVRIGLQIVGN